MEGIAFRFPALASVIRCFNFILYIPCTGIQKISFIFTKQGSDCQYYFVSFCIPSIQTALD